MNVQKECVWILKATKHQKNVTFAELNQLRRKNRHLSAYSASEKLQIVSYLERNCGITKSYLANPDAHQCDMVLVFPQMRKLQQPEGETDRYRYERIGERLF